jgi:hypothetical protein
MNQSMRSVTALCALYFVPVPFGCYFSYDCESSDPKHKVQSSKYSRQ